MNRAGNENATMLFTLWSDIMEVVDNPEKQITIDITTSTPNQNLNPEMWINIPSSSHAEENLAEENITEENPTILRENNFNQA